MGFGVWVGKEGCRLLCSIIDERSLIVVSVMYRRNSLWCGMRSCLWILYKWCFQVPFGQLCAFNEGIRPPIICSILTSTIHLRYVLLLPRKGCWSLDWTQHNPISNFFLSLDLFCQNGVSSYLLFVSIASTICDFWSKEKVAGVWTVTHRT